MKPRESIENTLRVFVAREVSEALAPHLELLARIERFLAPLQAPAPKRRRRTQRPKPRRRPGPRPALTAWDVQILKYLAADIRGRDLALAARLTVKTLKDRLGELYEKLGVANEKNPRAAAVLRFRSMRGTREAPPLPPSPIPFAVDQIVRVPQMRGTAEATILAIDPVSGDLTLELVEDGRVFQLPSAKAIRQSA